MNNKKSDQKTIVRYSINVRDYLKNDIARWNFIVMGIMLTFLIVVNITYPLVHSADQFEYNVWAFLSLMSSLFGMLNVTTYSIMNLNSDKRDRYRIFILFNSIAVGCLAAVNFHYHLTVLFIENILFFCSGCYQYYNWFLKYDIQKWSKNRTSSDIKDEKNDDEIIILNSEVGIEKNDASSLELVQETKEEKDEKPIFNFYRYNINDNLYFIIAILLILVFIFAQLAFPQLTGYPEDSDWFSDTAKSYYLPRMIIDACLGVGGMLGAFMVAKRKYSAVYIYMFNDIALIFFWLWIGIYGLNHDNYYDWFTALNLIPLFTFYFLSNVWNRFKWKKTLV